MYKYAFGVVVDLPLFICCSLEKRLHSLFSVIFLCFLRSFSLNLFLSLSLSHRSKSVARRRLSTPSFSLCLSHKHSVFFSSFPLPSSLHRCYGKSVCVCVLLLLVIYLYSTRNVCMVYTHRKHTSHITRIAYSTHDIHITHSDDYYRNRYPDTGIHQDSWSCAMRVYTISHLNGYLSSILVYAKKQSFSVNGCQSGSGRHTHTHAHARQHHQ